MSEQEPVISEVTWEDEDGQLYKRVWDDGPKDVPVTGADVNVR